MPDHPAEDRPSAPDLAPGSVRRERELPVPADEAWSLLQDAEGLSRWLADDVDLTVSPGERGTLRDGDEERFVEVEAVEVGRRVALRWWTESAPNDVALVDLTLDELGAHRSRLVVTEVPSQVVSVPDTLPAHWNVQARGPELLACA